MLAVSGRFIAELPRKLINICLVSHLDFQYQKNTQHKLNFFKLDIYISNKILQLQEAYVKK